MVYNMTAVDMETKYLGFQFLQNYQIEQAPERNQPCHLKIIL